MGDDFGQLSHHANATRQRKSCLWCSPDCPPSPDGESRVHWELLWKDTPVGNTSRSCWEECMVNESLLAGADAGQPLVSRILFSSLGSHASGPRLDSEVTSGIQRTVQLKSCMSEGTTVYLVGTVDTPFQGHSKRLAVVMELKCKKQNVILLQINRIRLKNIVKYYKTLLQPLTQMESHCFCKHIGQISRFLIAAPPPSL